MRFSNFSNIVSSLYYLNKIRTSYLNSLSDDIKKLVSENEFHEKTELMLNMMIREFFGENSSEIIKFIKTGYITKIEEEKVIEINTLDDYLKYAKSKYFYKKQ